MSPLKSKNNQIEKYLCEDLIRFPGQRSSELQKLKLKRSFEDAVESNEIAGVLYVHLNPTYNAVENISIIYSFTYEDLIR